MELEHRDITEQIIGASFEVFRELGYGFLERVYQQAMKVELELRGLKAEIEADIQVQYKNHVVGNYRADIVVNGCILVELKVSPAIDSRDEAQLLNELNDRNQDRTPSQLWQTKSRVQSSCVLIPCYSVLFRG